MLIKMIDDNDGKQLSEYIGYGRECSIMCGDCCVFCYHTPFVGDDDYYCNHPVMFGEPLSSVPYCPLEKYTPIFGKWVWDEDLREYISCVLFRMKTLKECEECGIEPILNTSSQEIKRRELHDIILCDINEERGSEWEREFGKYIELKVMKMMQNDNDE